MDPIRKIEVEPLSEPRWAKIEKSLFAQLEHAELDREPQIKMVSEPPPARSWRWRPAVALVMAGAMAAAVGALATKSLFVSPVSPVASAPSRVVTGSSDSHVALGESDVDVAPESAVLVSGDDERGIMVVVDRGKVGPRCKTLAVDVSSGVEMSKGIKDSDKIIQFVAAVRAADIQLAKIFHETLSAA